ncbi:MAG: hypothetical protein NTZ84_02065 [Candidatus Nealsonbacteria bacterium]|nr:hypothetical protein [Candidatus Nealsonbacteria bacterium]
MRKDYEKLFSNLSPLEPPKGLFDRIIVAIRKEQELRKTRRLLFGFLSVLIISSVMMPFSWKLLLEQAQSSGILYFISAAFGNFGVFLSLWQNFSLAIVESLPIAAIVIFTINIALILFTIRLFLHRKKLLFSFLTSSY